MNWIVTTQITGGVALTAGALIRYIIFRRKFNRRTIAGSEVFKSYEKARLTNFIERFGKLIALILIVGGIVLILIPLFRIY